MFAALFVLRAWNIHQHFFLLGEQIRDWSVALGPFSSLPLTGPPSTAGGHGLGPTYYWILWAVRLACGPAFGDLPHAAGVGLAVLQSAADALLFHALWRRIESPWLAVAAIALSAAGQFDVGMSTLIWNPPVANALAKSAMALFLLSPRGSRPWLYATMATAWMALQVHSTALFIAGPIFAWLIGREIVGRQWRAAGIAVRAALDCILVLEIPYVLDLLGGTGASGGAPGSRAFATFSAASGTSRGVTMIRSWDALTSRANFLFADAWTVQAFVWIMTVAVALMCWRARRDPSLLVVTVLPLVMATAVLAPWREPESYWYLLIGPPAAITLVVGLSAVGSARVVNGCAIALVVLLVLAAPVRYRASQTDKYFRFPNYGALLRGSREIVKRQDGIRDLRTSFELPPSTDRLYLFTLLGGRLNAEGPVVAIVATDGSVSYVRAAP
jgi:hypothetical protein